GQQLVQPGRLGAWSGVAAAVHGVGGPQAQLQGGQGVARAGVDQQGGGQLVALALALEVEAVGLAEVPGEAQGRLVVVDDAPGGAVGGQGRAGLGEQGRRGARHRPRPRRRGDSELDTLLSKFVDRTRILDRPVGLARPHYDFVFLDTPPWAGATTTVAAYAV